MTTLAEFEAAGGFVPDEPLARSITWSPNGGETTLEGEIWVRILSLAETEKLYRSLNGRTDEHSISTLWISSAVTCGPEGKERLSYRKAARLHPKLGDAMLLEVREVNGLTAKKA